MYACVCPPSCALLLFAFAANVRPRHRFQARLRNGLLANHAYSVCALSHPIECLFDSSVARQFDATESAAPLPHRHWLGQSYLPASPCRWHPGLSRAQGRRHLTLFLQQQIAVSLQIGWAHDLSSVGGNLAYGPDSTPTRTPCPQHASVWKSLLTSYPPSGIEVCEPEEAEGDRRPAGGRAGRRTRSRLPALWPLPLVTLIWCVR